MRRLAALFLVIPLLGAAAVPAVAQSLTTTDDLLSGFVTEEVEPGVLRVVNDGVRGLAQVTRDSPSSDIIAGPDGSVWLGDADRQLRLGDADVYEDLSGWPWRYEVAPDGSLWGVTDDYVYSLDGESWTERWDAANGTISLGDLAAAPDGTIWVTGTGEAGETTGLYRLADGGPATVTPDWTDVYPRAAGAGQVVVAGNGDVWLIGEQAADLPGYDNGGPKVDAFLRFDGSGWEVVEVPDDLRYGWAGQSFDIGSDGTLWAAVGDASVNDDGLARLDDSGWTVFTEADGVRPWGTYGFIPTDHLHVAPDGSVWLNAEGDGVSCGGVADFDGTTWTGYLTNLCVHDIDIAPDGAVWVRAGTYSVSGGFEYWDSPGTYVIRPEAAAATSAPAEAPASPDAVTLSPMPMPGWGDMDFAPTFFEGEVDWTACCGGCLTIGNPATTFCSDRLRGSMETSDPRLDGQVAADTIAATRAVRIENERRAWRGALGTAEDEAGMRGASRFGAWLVGEDAYEGLNAFMYATSVSAEADPDSQRWTVEGWVFDDVPWPEPLPEE